MKVGLAVFEFINNDIEYNLSQIERAINRAGDIDLLCFGEAFVQGFDSLCWKYDIDKEVAISQDSIIFKRLKQLSIMYKIDLLFGYIEIDKEHIYSSCCVIEKGNIIFNYRRISDGWKEIDKTDSHYKEGEVIESFNYHGLPITIALCGDLWVYKEKFKTNGLIIWPVYVNYSIEEWNDEINEYVRQANYVCNDVLFVNSLSKTPVSVGGAFYCKKYNIIERLDFNKEDILVCEIGN